MIINQGASFGLIIPAIEVFQLLFIIVLGMMWWRDKKAWGWGLMILGGGLNLIERLRFGGVRDYWQIPMTQIYNNINDYLIAIGVLQLVFNFIWKKRQK